MDCLNTYLLKLKHDNGIMSLYITAYNKDTAIHIAMESEACPRRAIFSIHKLKTLKIL